MEELQVLIKEQIETITETIKDQYIYTSEIQQKQHDKQMDIFRIQNSQENSKLNYHVMS